jgi:hypothetical protein
MTILELPAEAGTLRGSPRLLFDVLLPGIEKVLEHLHQDVALDVAAETRANRDADAVLCFGHGAYAIRIPCSLVVTLPAWSWCDSSIRPQNLSGSVGRNRVSTHD